MKISLKNITKKSVAGSLLSLVFVFSLFLVFATFQKISGANVSANLIANPSVEIATVTPSIPESWSTRVTGTNTTSFTYPGAGFDGTRGMRIDMTARSTGNASWMFNTVSVLPKTVYTFSDYYRSNVPTVVKVQYKLTTGGTRTVNLGAVAASTNWTQKTFQFTTPARATSATIMHMLTRKGYLETDMYSLTYIDNSTPSSSPTPSTSPTPTVAPSPTATVTPSPTVTPTPTVTPSASPTPTVAPSPTATVTPSPTVTPTPTVTPSPSPTPTSTPIASVNLIQNASLETEQNNEPANWYKGNWGTNSVAFSYPVAGQEGTSAAELNISSYTDGDAKWFFDDIPVVSGTPYEYSDYSKSTKDSLIVVRYTSNTGAFTYVDIGTVPANADWQHFSTTLTPPANVVSLTVFHLLNETGTLTVDNFSLKQLEVTPSPTPSPTPTATPSVSPTPTVVPSPTATVTPTPSPTPSPSPTSSPNPTPAGNLIANSTFEDLSGSDPLHWNRGNWGTNNAVLSYPVPGVDGSGAKATITSLSDGDAKWFFDDVTVSPGREYTFTDSYMSDVATSIVIRYTQTDGSNVYEYLEDIPASATWQVYNRKFTVPANVVSLTIFHLLGQVGSLTIDNAYLVPVPLPQPFAEGMISLDFDDGWLSTYQNGLPILNAAGYKSTQYIVSRYVGFPAYVTIEQILDMQAQGHEIGAHSQTHADLTALSEAEIRSEIIGSKTDLESYVTQPIKGFAYPYGAWNALTDLIVREAFSGGRTDLPEDNGFNGKNGNPYLLRTQSVELSTPLSTIEGWIDTALANKTWLILVLHQVEDGGGAYSITPARLQEIVNYLNSKGAKVVTVGEGISLMTP